MKIRREIQYEPLPSQLRFHDSAARFKGFSGPIGSGKSQALCNEAIKLAYLNAGRAGLIGAPTYPMLRDATQTSLFEVLRDNGLPFEFNKAENQLTLKDTGSKIIFRPLDDFERLCDELGLEIRARICLARSGAPSRLARNQLLSNLLSEQALFVLSRPARGSAA